MQKIAILTTHRANNFGAVLQAFSLVCACRELGAEATILDWRCRHFEWMYHKAWRMYRNPIPALKHFLSFVTKEKPIRRSFAEFRQLMPLTSTVYQWRQLPQLVKDCDAVIVGSDQVWNPINSAIEPMRFDRANLLSFVPPGVRRFAYAASIGAKMISPPSLLPEFVSAWRQFDRITMREHAGAEFVSKQIGRAVDTVVDPVFLHDVTFWRRYEKPTGTKKGKYIFIYNIRSSKSLIAAAERRSEALGIPIVDVRVPAIMTGTHCLKTSAGPSEFLSYIDDAESVFTDSFHASAFSVIFGKHLFLRQPKGKLTANSRFETLFRFSGIVKDCEGSDSKDGVAEVDCAKVNRVGLNAEISRSREILRRMVSASI